MAYCYFDVILAYFILSSDKFGAYSASSVLPKMIFTGLMPVMLMLFPLIISETAIVRAATVRRIGFVLSLLAAAAALVLIVVSPIVCESRYGLRYCQATPFDDMLVALIPLTLLRLLVFVAFAGIRDRLPMLILLPMAVFAAIIKLTGVNEPAILARDFMWFAVGGLLFFWVALRGAPKTAQG
jgi:hypothetical protein